MSQFWQKRQERLQPAVPNESTEVPGRKWFSGFFSIGSTQKPLERPYVVRTISSPSRARTKQRPRCPPRSLQVRGQTSHWIRPSSRRCQYLVGTTESASAIFVTDCAASESPAIVRADGLADRLGRAELPPARGDRRRARAVTPVPRPADRDRHPPRA